jgi:hypothetical protein
MLKVIVNGKEVKEADLKEDVVVEISTDDEGNVSGGTVSPYSGGGPGEPH